MAKKDEAKISHRDGYDKVVEGWEETLAKKYPDAEQRAANKATFKAETVKAARKSN